jgi:hypothetical protein
MAHQFEIAGVVQGLSELLGKVQTMIEFTEGEKPCVAGRRR